MVQVGATQRRPQAREQPRSGPRVATQLEPFRFLQQTVNDFVGDVAAEGGADETLVALELLPVLFLAVVPALALDARFDACLQQYRVEGLEQVVVGAGLDALDDPIHILVS